MLTIITFIVYQCILIIGFPIIILYAFYRKYRGKTILGIAKHRLGFVPSSAGSNPIWVHAASVGETLATEYLLKDFSSAGSATYLTSGTPNGFRMSAKFVVGNRALLPLDFLPCILLAFWRIKPKALVIIEGDWWPNLLFVARFLNIPCYALNARVNERPGISSLFLKIMCKTVLQSFKHLYVQTDADKAKFAQHGISSKRLSPMRNIKSYNVHRKLAELNLPKENFGFLILMAGSIHPTEEIIHLNLFKKIKQSHPACKLLLVPRHLHWLDALTKTASEYGSVYVLKQIPDANFHQKIASHDIVIGGALGLMFELYRYASLFLLGGTFVPVGGHNLLEPAVWGIGSIVGPYHKHCLDTLKDLEKNHCGFRVETPKELESLVEKILSRGEEKEMGLRAGHWLAGDAAQCAQDLQKFMITIRAN